MPAPDARYRNLLIKRAIELDAVECMDVRSILYTEAARIREEVRTLKPRQRRRLLSESYADRIRRIAEKFDD